MMRTVFAAAAGLICTLAGYRHASALRSDAKMLQRWAEIASRLALLLEEQAVSLPEVLQTAADADTDADRLLLDIAGDMAANPMTNAAQSFGAHCEGCPQQETLQRMFSRLGHGSVQSRITACRQSAALLQEAAGKARAVSDKDAKMWRTLGWTGGLCLSLLLI